MLLQPDHQFESHRLLVLTNSANIFHDAFLHFGNSLIHFDLILPLYVSLYPFLCLFSLCMFEFYNVCILF